MAAACAGGGTGVQRDDIEMMNAQASVRRVGLLGGSFNPAHEGHRHISVAALSWLELDAVWWLVSPQNPLKGTEDMAPLAERIVNARAVARHRQINVTGIEEELGTVYTIDTIAALQARFPDLRFVWLMGADNMVQIPHWKGWRQLFARVPVAVFPRPSYSDRALAGEAAQAFADARVPVSQARDLADLEPPAWLYLPTRPHAASATRIREEREARQRSRPAAGQRATGSPLKVDGRP